MPAIPVPLRPFGGARDDYVHLWRVTGAAYTGVWYAASVPSDPTLFMRNPDAFLTAPAGAVVASPTGAPYYYPDGDHFNIVASDRNPQGCSLTPSGGPFVVDVLRDADAAKYGVLGNRPLPYMAATFTYPTAWDDAPVRGTRQYPGHSPASCVGYLVFAEVRLTGTRENGAAASGRYFVFAQVNRLDLRGSDNRFHHGRDAYPVDYNLTIDPWDMGGSYDQSSVKIPAGFPVAAEMAHNSPGEAYARGFFNPVPATAPPGVPDRYKARIVVGSLWSAPPRVAVYSFVWNWGDGTESTVPAGETHYRDEPFTGESVGPGGYYTGAASGEAVSHEFEVESNTVYVRALDSWGRRSYPLTLRGQSGTAPEFGPETQLAATQSVHGELYTAVPVEGGLRIMRSVTNQGAAQQVSEVAGAKKAGLFHDAANQLFLCANTGGAWAISRSPDGGETWESMATSPFNAGGYSSVVPFSNMADGLIALVAVPKETAQIAFALYNGASWTAPRTIGSLPGSKALAAFQENFAGSSRLRVVADGLDLCSLDYGETWSNTP